MFKKYPSIENHYQTKEIEYWLEFFPDLLNMKFVLLEKLDGSNLSFIFKPNGEVRICSRNRILSPDENFMGVNDVLQKEVYKHLIEYYQTEARKLNVCIRLYGEIFGAGIQNKVYYGDHKSIRFFDVSLDGEFLPYNLVETYFKSIESTFAISSMCVPKLGIVKGLYTALGYDVERQSTYIFQANKNIMEGIVIKPYEHVIKNNTDRIFMLKKKSEGFKEKEKSKKVKIVKEVSENLLALHNTFMEYITENRLNNIFSKEGFITKPKEIGKYIGLMTEDAKEDFFKEHSIPDEYDNKKDKKFIFNAGPEIAKMLQKKM